MSRGGVLGLLLVVVASLGAASTAPDAPRAGAYLRVIGTVQDGGLPHAGCNCERCELAARDPRRKRHVASLALVLPSSRRVMLVDASPDLREQLRLLADVRDAPAGRTDRAPVDGVLLTHAHIGHYLGLAFLGFEAIHAQKIPTWCTPRMAAYLRGHGPWSQLITKENLELRELAPGATVDLGDGVRVTAIQVPHRDEFSDTVGFRFQGPRQTVLYVPDTDSWTAWGERLAPAFAGVDVALVDGTFYSADELPGRDVTKIGHPLITDTLERFAAQVAAGELRIGFTHLNHSNPALEPTSAARRTLDARPGFRVLEEGDEIGL